MYYCPKCDRSIAKEKVEETDRELRERFGVMTLSSLRCPVCDCEYIDLDRVTEGGQKHAGKARRKADTP